MGFNWFKTGRPRKSRTREIRDDIGRITAPPPGVPSLLAVPPPVALPDLPPDQIEFYLRGAIHQDRTPGNVLLICHPGKLYKFPRTLPDALREAGFNVTKIDTEPNRVRSAEKIRNALLVLSRERAPLDVIVVSGDGTLDHHVLIAAFWAFYPELVRYRPGTIDCSSIRGEDLAGLPASYRLTFFKTLPEGGSLEASEETIKEIWLLRSRLEGLLRRHRPVAAVVKLARRRPNDLLLRTAILGTLFPEKVTLRPHGFDLSGLASAPQEKMFRGLYPFIRCISTYPAGTAADNAVFAGVPGWSYGLVAGLLTRSRLFSPLRRWLEDNVTQAFLRYFIHGSVVVPARISVVGLDGDWQRISSHVAGGPAAGHFFSADLTSKTKSLFGYLKRIPRVIIKEGFFGSTIVRIRSRFASGVTKSFTEAQISEALYTNRTFIAGVGSVPTTNPTSFAGQSSLCVVPPIWYRNRKGYSSLNLRGLGVLFEAMSKGVLARILHMSGLGVGTLAGSGKFSSLLPEHQVAIKEGESIEIDYLTMEQRPRAIAIQVSGDPFQAYRMTLRTVWGPIPLLGERNSLLLAATRRSLADLHLQQTYRLERVYIGGVRYFRHHIGEDWVPAFAARTGLVQPPNHLPRNLPLVQRMLLDAWQQAGAGDFVDTTQAGLALWRQGRHAHNNDQSAHLVILREPQGTLLVRQVRTKNDTHGKIHELRARYRAVGASYIIYHSQTVVWHEDQYPQILQEDHFFKSAEAFQQDAPAFFPVLGRASQKTILLPAENAEEEPIRQSVREDTSTVSHKAPQDHPLTKL